MVSILWCAGMTMRLHFRLINEMQKKIPALCGDWYEFAEMQA
jgi:hypothetical protein